MQYGNMPYGHTVNPPVVQAVVAIACPFQGDTLG
jgi:hypothetical protein